jgi:hypothetical protein
MNGNDYIDTGHETYTKYWLVKPHGKKSLRGPSRRRYDNITMYLEGIFVTVQMRFKWLRMGYSGGLL